MKEFNLAVNACDFALAVNSECDKSYFLRAQSRLTPLNCGALEQEAALIDLRKAIEINPMNNEARCVSFDHLFVNSRGRLTT